jgi:hypothetical protein
MNPLSPLFLQPHIWITPAVCLLLQVADRLPNSPAVPVTAGEEGAAAHYRYPSFPSLHGPNFFTDTTFVCAAGC